jgi:hypothetical protein
VEKFVEYTGDLIGLPTDDNHLIFKWNKSNCKILFSAAQQGGGMSIHFASDKKGLRKIEQAGNEFCNFIFENFPWCTMIMAKIKKSSVERLALKCNFIPLFKDEKTGVKIYGRLKNG